jgi:hypothetical protein
VARREYLGWLLEARAELTGAGYPFTDIRGSLFFTACICAADVPFSPPNLWPHAEVGLMTGMTLNSHAATNRWLSLLAGGDFDPKLIVEPPAGRTFHPVSPVFDLTAPQPPANLAPNWRHEL